MGPASTANGAGTEGFWAGFSLVFGVTLEAEVDDESLGADLAAFLPGFTNGLWAFRGAGDRGGGRRDTWLTGGRPLFCRVP